MYKRQGLNILIAIVGTFVLMGGLIWMSFRVADDPGLRGHINAETRTSPAYPAGDTEHIYTVYHDPLPLTVEDLVGETTYTDYSCYREIQGSPLLTEYTYRQEVPFVFSISDQDGPELFYSVYQVHLGCLYKPVKDSFFREVQRRNRNSYLISSCDWKTVDAAPWGAQEAYQYVCDGELWGTYLLCYQDRMVKISFAPWYDTLPTAEQMTLVEAILGND